MQKTNMICSFCGRSQPDVNKFIASPSGDAFICDECIALCGDIINSGSLPKQSTHKLLSPMEIKSCLDEYIIGQDNAKIVLSVAVYNHYKKIGFNLSK